MTAALAGVMCGTLVNIRFDGIGARPEWLRETAKTLQEVSIYRGDSRETKLATLPCVRAAENA